jgi:hypothetical protein
MANIMTICLKTKYNATVYCIIFLLIYITAVFTGCSKNNSMTPDESWVRVYDHSDFNRLFYALDVKELSNNNFIILASSKMDTTIWPSPYIVSTDKEGFTLWSVQMETYTSPVPNIITLNGENYFFCMDNFLGTHLLKINTDGSSPTEYKSFPDITYPLCASQTADNKILLTSYNRITRSTVLTCFDSNLSIIWNKEYNGIENYEEKVRLHLTRQGAYFPFFSGEIKSNGSGYYFVNGFYNFVFSLLFVNQSNGSLSGVINGIPYSAAASALIQRNDTSYVLARYDENQNYINIKPDISFTAISNITAMGGTSWPEIDKNSVIAPLRTKVNGKEIIILSAITRSKQVLLLFFDPETGLLKTSKYFGSTYPVNLASVIPTLEGGLAVLTQTYVAGRFPRIQLFKIPPEKLKF